MMIKNYVEYTINRKIKYIYLEKGRWLFILFSLIIFAVGNASRYEQDHQGSNLISTITLILTSFGFLSILFYAIPVYLKKQRYTPFILFIIFVISISVVIETTVNFYFRTSESSLTDVILESFIYNFSVFTNTTSFAFFIETIDEISLRKESKKDLKILKDSQRKLAGTHTDLAFMLNNLSSIKENMLRADSTEQNTDSDQLLQLSDILRYKLYGYDQEHVPIEDEIIILDKMISQKNHYLSLNDGTEINWEFDIKDNQLTITKCTLVNILTPLFDSAGGIDIGNKILYLLVENHIANFFIEIDNIKEQQAAELEKSIKKEIFNYNKPYNLTAEYSENRATYNLTLQLWKK